MGAAYGTAKAGVGVCATAVLRPDLIVKSMSRTAYSISLFHTSKENFELDDWPITLDIVPIVMAGIIGIYGLVVSVLIADGLKQSLPLYTGFIQLGAGLAVGLSGLAAGYAQPWVFEICHRAWTIASQNRKTNLNF